MSQQHAHLGPVSCKIYFTQELRAGLEYMRFSVIFQLIRVLVTRGIIKSSISRTSGLFLAIIRPLMWCWRTASWKLYNIFFLFSMWIGTNDLFMRRPLETIIGLATSNDVQNLWHQSFHRSELNNADDNSLSDKIRRHNLEIVGCSQSEVYRSCPEWKCWLRFRISLKLSGWVASQ